MTDLTPEQIAKGILDDWVEECRVHNVSGRVELTDVSNWAEKCHEINENCPSLGSPDGVFLLFCLGSLLSFGGGNYRARVTEIKNKYNALMSRRFEKDDDCCSFSQERRERFKAIDLHIQSLVAKHGTSNFLQEWWNTKKESCGGDLNKATESILSDIHGWSYVTREGERSLFTVKVFWIPRELNANDIWSDFPVEYCCVPDSYVKNVLCELYGRAKYAKIFGIRYGDPSFNIDSSILMSKKTFELVSKDKIDGYYPYDLPLFRNGYLSKRATKLCY